ncbi:hypothetical protein TESG_08399 [Trichophyton tonsurans CBS 112818]|uniref:Uncharacterized protein n=1 Tax=Trichophyton tonsurans (strain CBS 112818) TaxID=647933 RepID=F2RWG1_TRIT1|nr:hypothetical protein TESG_08399 [Trichophyton tonsurans CBS 112818]
MRLVKIEDSPLKDKRKRELKIESILRITPRKAIRDFGSPEDQSNLSNIAEDKLKDVEKDCPVPIALDKEEEHKGIPKSAISGAGDASSFDKKGDKEFGNLKSYPIKDNFKENLKVEDKEAARISANYRLLDLDPKEDHKIDKKTHENKEFKDKIPELARIFLDNIGVKGPKTTYDNKEVIPRIRQYDSGVWTKTKNAYNVGKREYRAILKALKKF